MARKRYTAEQIIRFLRQADVTTMFPYFTLALD